MKRFTQNAFSRAKHFIATHGRELDRNLLAYLFEDGRQDQVIEALGAFQNPDGGFGNALEPDIRASASSAVATQQAFDYLRLAGVDESERLVRQGVEFLLNNFDQDRRVWPIIPPEVEDATHAPWWSYEESDENFGGFRANPTAALAGHLHRY